MLGVFLLPAFTRIGHEPLILLNLREGMHILDLGLFILIQKSFRRMESESMSTPRENAPLPEKFSPEED